MPHEHISGHEVIARYDMVEIFVKKTKSNLEKIKTIKGDLIADLADFYREPGKLKRQGRWKRQNLTNRYGNLILFWPIESNLNELLRIRIIDKCKWDWEVHRDNIRSIGDILDIYGIEYAISKAELAFDTLSKETAESFFTSVSLKWGRTRRLFNYERGTYLRGGSSTGVDEYMFNRLSSRQTHSYEKRYKQNGLSGGKVDETIYRWELRLRREHLHSKGIETIEDLMSGAEALIGNTLVFKKLNRRKLNKEIRRAKDWRLAGRSIAEQQRMMARNGLSKDQIKKYFDVVEQPRNVIFTLASEDSIRPQKSPCGYRYALWGELISRYRREHNKGVN
jgi:hypothetical protein